ncbi:large conductance mechanosensitive channel protein MscL [Neobacillus piezotolerans]|uniref:Large-conductance mechanosensitive channel n=1 Tax=Neobacillus piezotolerans TaxID=2259171 RepID=A0A3D8GQP9_9BACI|nr:large conductance mechanosensitive channel protein MscL [Neobacillus piezotolerans]RDU36813.1 large conductance mechanosensitive channel protein MscL [Neobacillus piezotolerans]
MLQDFKKFAMKGNVLDLAVGVIIGAAFGKIVTSLVQDILMPIIGLLMGGINLKGLKIKVGDAEVLYGIFLQSFVDFLIVSFSIFLFIKIIQHFRHKHEEEEEQEIEEKVDKTEELLTEIRDLLKDQAKQSADRG